MSIRLTHLALLLGLAMLAVGTGGVVATWRIADAEFREVLEQDLEQQAELLAELLTASPAQVTDQALRTLLADVFENDDEDTVWVSVYDLAGGGMQSNLDHELPLVDDADGPIARQLGGFGWHGMQDREGELVVQLLRRDDLYLEVREEIIESIVTPALAGIAVMLLLLAVLMLLVLRPLSRLALEIEQRHADSLAPLVTPAATREIRVLRDAVNDLLRGIDAVVARERQFASDVAHELRTPLTTLGLELGSADPDMDAVREESGRLKRLVDGLLTLARIDQAGWQSRFETVALDELGAGIVDSMHARLRQAGIGLEVSLEPIGISGDATLLGILFRNLLENLIEHCPAGTHARLGLVAEAPGGDGQRGAAVLTLVDNGPGMPAELLERMTAGFSRLDSKSEGFGLGLAICHRIVATHHGTLRFASGSAGGLTVEARFPA